MNTPITCNGNDLASVCADLEARGFVPWAVDASVKTNAGYRVSYFERAVGIGSEHRRQECVDGIKSQQVNTPAALANFVMQRDCSDATQTSTRPVSEAASKQRNPVVGTEKRADGWTRVSTKADTTEALGSGWAHSPHDDSIETRLAALQAKLRAAGKLKNKPSTEPKYARLPHAND